MLLELLERLENAGPTVGKPVISAKEEEDEKDETDAVDDDRGLTVGSPNPVVHG